MSESRKKKKAKKDKYHHEAKTKDEKKRKMVSRNLNFCWNFVHIIKRPYIYVLFCTHMKKGKHYGRKLQLGYKSTVKVCLPDSVLLPFHEIDVTLSSTSHSRVYTSNFE